MPIRPSIRTHVCAAGAWTNLWEAPCPGYVKIFSSVEVRIEWDRANEHPLWYWKEGATLFPGWNQFTFSPPSAFTIFRINPSRTITISVSESG